MPWTDAFVNHLRKRMEEIGLTQEALAEKAGIHFTTVNRILNRRIEPTVATCEKLAKAAGLREEKIFSRTA